jgi:hypothetical protein
MSWVSGILIKIPLFEVGGTFRARSSADGAHLIGVDMCLSPCFIYLFFYLFIVMLIWVFVYILNEF